MDIRKKSEMKKVANSQSKGDSGETGFKSGMVTTANAKAMLPSQIQTKLSELGQKYNVPFDLTDIKLDGKMAENVKALRTISDMALADSKLLPEMIKLIRRLMKAEIKLAQFHKLVTKAAIKHQEKIDKQTADIFLAMSGYQSKASKLEYRTNVRNKIKEERKQAYADYYQNSVYGGESKIIDIEFEVLESNRKVLTDSKTKKVEFEKDRRAKLEEYVRSAYDT